LIVPVQLIAIYLAYLLGLSSYEDGHRRVFNQKVFHVISQRKLLPNYNCQNV